MVQRESMLNFSKYNYRETRKKHWNRVANVPLRFMAMKHYYHEYLTKVYQFLVPRGLRILEVGCGQGDLLAALAPSEGIGLDFSQEMCRKARQKHPELVFIEEDIHDLDVAALPEALKNNFDIIILSDIVNDLWDVHEALKLVHALSTPHTRIILNFHSHLFEKPASLVEALGAMTPRLPQNWLTVDDVHNLLNLTDFELIRGFDDFLWPWKTPGVAVFMNRWLAKFAPFRLFCLTHFLICRPVSQPSPPCTVSVIIPTRNEAGNIGAAIARIPEIGLGTEIIFVEGNSTDNTWETIENIRQQHPERNIRAFQQSGKGKGDAVRVGFEKARGEILMILDGDLTVPPESLTQFYQTLISGKAEFVNGVRMVYPQEEKAMRFFNLLGNKFFSFAFSWLLGFSIKDTLCGTKALWRKDYRSIVGNRSYFGDFDPFGDYDLIFGAVKLNLKIVDLPIRYAERTYGDTNISRWRDGNILLKMTAYAARRIKFIP